MVNNGINKLHHFLKTFLTFTASYPCSPTKNVTYRRCNNIHKKSKINGLDVAKGKKEWERCVSNQTFCFFKSSKT